LFPTLADWIECTAQIALEVESVNWIFRIHPAEANYGSVEDTAALVRAIVPAGCRHIHVVDSATPVSSYSLVNRMKAGVTVRGTLAVELPCFGIPVICAGGGHTAVTDYNIFPQTIELYRQTLLGIENVKPLSKQQIDEALLFAYGFFIKKTIQFECVQNFVDLRQLRQLTLERILNDPGIALAADRIMTGVTDPTKDLAFG
jgi:hypothetical protein